MMKQVLLTSVLALSFPILWAQPSAGHISDLVNKLYTSNQFNGAILVADSGEVVHEGAYGWADVSARDTLSIHSSFHLGELSNQFTAMAVALLVEDGKIEYDDDISDYLSELPYQNIRVKDLINHTSGLPDYFELSEKYWEDKSRPITNHDLLAIFRDHEPPLAFQPGYQFLYSNTGYAFLATLVERVALQAFGDFVREQIFTPLEMEHSFLYLPYSRKTLPPRVSGYRLSMMKAYQPAPESYLNGIIGDKGIYASVADLYKWTQALATEQLISREGIEILLTPGTLNNKATTYYAGGWVVLPNPNVMYHDGAWEGFSTTLVRYPEAGHVIIVLSNRSDRVVSIQRIISRILEGKPFQRPWSSVKEAITRKRFRRKYKIPYKGL